MARPAHLPDFKNPPLEEVVLGVQFSAIPGYMSVFSHEVWGLFQATHPKVSEHPMLSPNFESFGGGNPQPSLQFQMGPAPTGSRQWFSTIEGNDLIQFQADRFVANWRKQATSPEYPRFEGISRAFEENLRKLNEYASTRFGAPLAVNQAEISYINIIPVDDFSDATHWFKLWDNGEISIENLNINFDEVVKDENAKPFARLKHHIQSVFSTDGSRKAFRLSLTFIGKPNSSDINGAMNFVRMGRERIVTRFGVITTEKAQSSWERLS
ncbi:TIGR04255 family protein [Nitratireductor aquibiodomus]|uniref:TIGR04255 family protein n=1 Tax=Nitratireductor aquibiodomus TaxID=204799 RepID=UPI0009DAAFC0|nr:TIGR04255 family protein [Nitratireductor aquibiodomus]